MKTRRDTIKYSKITTTAFALLVLSMFSYLYFLNMSVVEVVMRSEQIQVQRDLKNQIAQLENDYIEAEHNITSKMTILNTDYSEVKKYFVSRTENSFVLRDN